MASSSHSEPGSSSSRSCKHDVFLSFRGEDTRLGFVDHLYKALVDKSINTFKDNINLLQGEYIGPSLFTAIEESQIALIVFSENYANSSWCLEELTYIMKCKEDRGLIVMPIFYGVEPTDVKKHKRKYEEAFARYENENTTKVELWKKALADASKISGFDSKNRPEAEFVKEIIDKIFDRLPSFNSYVDEEFVGMKTRLQDVISRLEIGSGVRMVGIWGIGGGGKTTLATSVYMEISHDFEDTCIIENIQEESSKYGLKKLQENILSAVFNKEVKVPNVVEGKYMIRNMLCRRKVLVVLDDVDKHEQLEALAGSRNWFGSGSRIIITTRDEHVLRAHKVDKVCPLRLLSDKEAMDLFNRHAYNEEESIEDYERLSTRVVSYAAGLPLALKVLGSFLCDKDEKEWLSALARLEKIPNMKIVEKLKISYDGLTTEEKELFLDIACFFRKCYYADYDPREILEACGFHVEIGIKVLRQKSLITIDAMGGFKMHDLVIEMAHYIVRGEHPDNVEYQSRIWSENEVENMCLWDAREKNDKIEAIGRRYIHHLSRFCKNVSNMKKLRWLWVDSRISNNAGDEGPTFLSNELRYIWWREYPGISFPESFQPTKLVVLKLRGGRQKVLWNSDKDLPCLKVLQLDYMKNLVSTPDFDRLPCLQKLTLRFCEALEEIHPSLGNHTRLEYIRVVVCRKLREFTSLNTLPQLRKLDLCGCGLLEGKTLSSIFKQSNLEELNLSWNDFTRLDSSLLQLTQLKILNLDDCKRLVELPELPSSIAILKAPWCESLTDSFTNCKCLCYYVTLDDDRGRIKDGDRVIESILQGIENGTLKLLRLSGRFEIPKGLAPFLRQGDECRLEPLPENWRNEFSGFLFFSVRKTRMSTRFIEITLKKVMSGSVDCEVQDWKESDDDKKTWTWLGYISFASLREHATDWWDDQTYNHLSFSIVDFYGQSINGFGVRLVGRRSEISGSTTTHVPSHFSLPRDISVDEKYFLIRQFLEQGPLNITLF